MTKHGPELIKLAEDVFSYLQTNGPRSIPEIQDEMFIPPPRIYNVFNVLIEAKRIHKVGHVHAGTGPKAAVWDIKDGLRKEMWRRGFLKGHYCQCPPTNVYRPTRKW